ncbi:MAG: hypothetical protein MJ189_02915 [Coriobacteriales bacterium]|nr:hypothetical protein [Coriobacteriales bacterium]
MPYELMYFIEPGKGFDKYSYPYITKEKKLEIDNLDCTLSQGLYGSKISIYADTDLVYCKENANTYFYITNSRLIFCDSPFDANCNLNLNATQNSTSLCDSNQNTTDDFDDVKICIGHLRYEWLGAIRYDQKLSETSKDTLTFFYTSDDKFYRVELVFAISTDTKLIATGIFKRCVNYRINMSDEKSAEENDFFNNALSQQWAKVDSGTGAYIEIYSSYNPPLGGKSYYPSLKQDIERQNQVLDNKVNEENKEFEDQKITLKDYHFDNREKLWDEYGFSGLESQIASLCDTFVNAAPDVPLTQEIASLAKGIRNNIDNKSKMKLSFDIHYQITQNLELLSSIEEALLIMFYCGAIDVLYGKYLFNAQKKALSDLDSLFYDKQYWLAPLEKFQYPDIWVLLEAWFTFVVDKEVK